MSTTATTTTKTAESVTQPPFPSYSDTQLQDALKSLLHDSTNPDFDARHILGYMNEATHELSKLQRITATRILQYEKLFSSSSAPSIEALTQQAADFATQHGPILNLQTVITEQSPRMALAAEFKRASPSKGAIALDLNAGEQAVRYTQAGANIISVLTEEQWFQGSLADMTQVRLETSQYIASPLPKKTGATAAHRPAVLRKDFVINRYMIAEAAAAGADTILLIVAVLPQHVLQDLIHYARTEFQMEPLVEVHADVELEVALEAGAKVIGVNNRNLHNFHLDLSTSERIAKQLSDKGLRFHHHDKSQPPPEYTLCALSGMSTALDVDRYRQVGLGMCLIGESLMRATDPVAAIANLCLHPDDFVKMNANNGVGGAYTSGTKLVKVCGITNPDDALVACQAGANIIGVIFAAKSKRLVTAEQAKEIVKCVRAFGERNQRIEFTSKTSTEKTNAMSALVQSSLLLAEATRRPAVVGVFQNQSPEFIRQIVDECGLDLVQLHGSEGMAAANIAVTSVPTIRVIDICVDPETGKASKRAIETILESISSDPVAILLDTAIKGQKEGGGTGVSFDWGIARRLQDAGLPVLVAGGLTPESVKECVGSIRPFGVDVSSGVEVAPGKKDPEKVKAFVQGARQAEAEASKGF